MEIKLKPLYGDVQKKPFIIAGPCSAESEDQIMTTANALKEQNIDLFRAGIWKPRTRPNSFEGVGVVGLKWLKKVKEETGLKTTTEVAKANHVYECLKYGVDALWIGARTTVNPFAVQEIADALEGTDIPVMIKNPINPDLQLWIGGIERIYKAGINRIAVIHRGFSAYGETKYRNIPRWQIPIELKIAADLDGLRQKINHIDAELLKLLGQRMGVAENIGNYKKENNISILQPNRWDEILKTATAKGAENGLSEDFISVYLKAVHQESINHQTKIMNS